MTDFNYKKFFAARTAGGRRQYSVALVVDTSASMSGLSLAALSTTLVLLTSALVAAGIDNFSILTFDDRVRLVKAAGQPWDAVAQATLLAHLRADTGFRTMDAAAVEMAVAAVLEAGVRGPKRVYVLTDGFSSDYRALTHTLHRAERAGVEVVGVGVGTDMVITHRVYQHWLNAALPAALPDAFRELYGSEEGGSGAAEKVDPHEYVASHRPAEGDDSRSVGDILAARASVFRDVSDQLQEEREAKLTTGNSGGAMTVDVAFVLDVTGSMAPVIAAIRNEIATIVKSIPEEVLKAVPAARLLLRVALVPFRDRGDALPPLTPFGDPDPGAYTEESLREFNDRQVATVMGALRDLRAVGGGDIPEDVLGALSRATTGLAWKGKARYAVLITDAPSHGSRFHGPDVIDDFPGEGGQLEGVVERLVANQTELVMCHVNSTYTQKMASDMALAVVDAAKVHPGCVPDTPMLSMDLYDPAAPSAQFGGIHAVFVLDESGSMSSDFPGVIRAYKTFLGIRRAANQGRSNGGCRG